MRDRIRAPKRSTLAAQSFGIVEAMEAAESEVDNSLTRLTSKSLVQNRYESLSAR
jgi:predicted transcriptional regulator